MPEAGTPQGEEALRKNAEERAYDFGGELEAASAEALLDRMRAGAAPASLSRGPYAP